MHRGVGQNGIRDTQQAVGSHLQQNAGQDDGDGRGRFNVSVGEPGVEGENRHLNGEADIEAEPEQGADVVQVHPN